MKALPLAAILALFTLPCAHAQTTRERTPPTRHAGDAATIIDLRPRFEVGKAQRFRISMTARGKEAAPSSPGTPTTTIDTSMSQDIEISLVAREVDAERGSTLDLVYESMKISMKTPDGQQLTLDTNSKDKDDPLAGLLAPLAGLKVAIQMDKDGNITTMDAGAGGGLPMDPAALLGGGGNGPSINAAEVVRNLLGPVTTTAKSPGQASVGESWTTQDTIDAVWGRMQLSTTHTLSSHRGNVATIDTRGRFDLLPSSSTSPAPTIRDSMYTGRTSWNTQAHMIDEMTLKQRLVINKGTAGTSTQEMDVKVKRLGR
jgi:hypothetical protein